jgi:hypothetical protein
MTREVVYELTNNDPEHYNEVSAKIDIPWNCRRVEYWVDSMNTFSNFHVLTRDDYINVEYEVPEYDAEYTEGSASGDSFLNLNILIRAADDCRENWRCLVPTWTDDVCIWKTLWEN